MNLLLVGGGHAHIETLRGLSRARDAFASIVLATPHRWLVYSGAVPGYVAGHVPKDDLAIPLEPLAAAARVDLVQGAVVALDVARRLARLEDGRTLPFDIVSLNVGSGADAGVPEHPHAIGVRPLAAFIAFWEATREAAHAGRIGAIGVVGGGAAAVEVLCAMQHRLAEEVGRRAPGFVLVTETMALLPDHPAAVGRRFERILAERNVTVRRGLRVTSFDGESLVGEGGERIAVDRVVFATGARAHAWLSASGIAVDAEGFVRVDRTLRSVSHAAVFAAGDCASVAGVPAARSGVLAVRQGRLLAANLVRAASGAPLMAFEPPRRTLALIGTGGRDAVVSFGALAARGRWAWRWKRAIDANHVARYRDPLPVRRTD